MYPVIQHRLRFVHATDDLRVLRTRQNSTYLGANPLKPVTPEEMVVFRRNLALRQQVEHQRLDQQFEAARQVVQSANTLLKQGFQAREVILFGSLLHRERFHLSSDIDLAVRGLDPLDYFTAVAKLQDLSPFKIDLVRLERCKPSLAAVIATEGQPL